MDQSDLLLAILLPTLFVFIVIVMALLFRRFRFRRAYKGSPAMNARLAHMDSSSLRSRHGYKESVDSTIEHGQYDDDANDFGVNPGEFDADGGRREADGTRTFLNGWFGLDPADRGLVSETEARKGRHAPVGQGDEWNTSIDQYEEADDEKSNAYTPLHR